MTRKRPRIGRRVSGFAATTATATVVAVLAPVIDGDVGGVAFTVPVTAVVAIPPLSIMDGGIGFVAVAVPRAITLAATTAAAAAALLACLAETAFRDLQGSRRDSSVAARCVLALGHLRP